MGFSIFLIMNAYYCLLRPVSSTISLEDLNTADSLLLQFCVASEQLYGKEKCTPNMHLHCHICDTVTDYGPVYSMWCFAFERYNGVFESLKKFGYTQRCK